MPSILFIALIAFLVFGPRKLPEIATQDPAGARAMGAADEATDRIVE